MVEKERYLKPVVIICLIFSIIIFIGFILSGYLYRWELVDLNTGMIILKYSAYGGVVLLLCSVIILFLLTISNVDRRVKKWIALSLLLTSSISGFSYYWYHQANVNPPIHDISTDLINPPKFDAIIPLRAHASNPAVYAGEETARLQQQHFPDIQTIRIYAPIDAVFLAASNVVQNRNWEIASVNSSNYTIEATNKLPWFGFEDDVIVRLTLTDNGTLLDIRSKSRYGRSDLGVNANRIRKLIHDIEREINTLQS